MQQVKTKDMAVIALAIILVLFLWYRFVYSSMESQASKANHAAADAKTQSQSLDAQLRALTRNTAKKTTKAELNAAIPATPEVSNFLRDVQSIRDAVGIPAAFQTITPAPPSSANGATEISMGITVQGSYQQLLDYVNRLNHLSRLVVVDTVGVTAGASDGSSSSASGPPTGPLFAGQGAPPVLQFQLTTRLLTQATVAPPAGSTAAAPAPTTNS